MPHAVPVPVRRTLWERAQRGDTTQALATAFGLAPRTVRALCRRFRLGGPDAILPRYRVPPPPPHAKPPESVAAVCQLRREHPTWGAGLILVVLREQQPQQPWPSERTAQRWLRQAGLAPAPKGRRPGVNPRRATQPHEVWQMDGAECIPLASGQQVCWLRIVDEFTGAVLRTTVFPPEAMEPGGRPGHPGRTAGGVLALGAPVPHPRR
jgi:transposase